ncbi:gamma-glutamyl-gamma-aminobutyrate hydrolase family protein [Sphingosinicella sp.]|uniref:gamma-glutamyl-gamma-aminobutyrate hydrolase family protein n=1 Tax=Sphingosinicella sp. TaxID=1917971 RepID=UPI0017EC4674|nr:gamma-glutamyl-gamma-aminobutyrate hydrolase family protein [Sphingosinicella sp.]MBA4757445.1 gamma-glutamyl-gamma-aminobutyrate hydrolase family protein [Sphingosinicella sp.]
MTTARPVLGIICCQRTVGTEPAQAVIERYVRAAMRYADVAALLIPSLPDLMTAAEVAPRLDGVLLTGSPSNIEGNRYDDEGGEGPFDPGRDEIALSMVDAMIGRGRPVFGICRGFQEINVALGGTLRRDTSASDDLIRHHAPDGVSFDAMFDHRHRVDLVPGGLLARTYDTPSLDVNSVHFQGIGRLADSLTVEATAPDGLVEAYSATIGKSPVVAVQWHPEWHPESNLDSQTFFKLLGQTLRGTA